MVVSKDWFDNDAFWEVMASTIFTTERWLSASDQVDSIESLLHLKPGISILDHCCGPGRHSLELARRGYHVTGVDRTEQYLAEARKKAEAEGLQIEFVRTDMRDFVRARSFDAAINLFTSFGYFEDPEEDRRVAKHLYESLKPGGRLLIDLMGKEVAARVFHARDWFRENDGSLFLQERRVTKDWSWLENKWTLIKDGQVFEFEFSHRPYSAAELVELLRECGFRTTRVCGNLAGAQYDNEATRLVVVAQK